jgi:hypothetical protein
MIQKWLRVLVAGLISMAVLTIVLSILPIITGRPVTDDWFLLLGPFGILAFYAAYGRESNSPTAEVYKVFALVGSVMAISNVLPNWIGLCLIIPLIAGALLAYGRPAIAGLKFLRAERAREKSGR